MNARRLLLATALPAALLAGPMAGAAMADTPTAPDISGTSGSVTFAAAAEGTAIKQIEVDLPMGTPMRDVTVPNMAGGTSATTTAALPSCGDQTVSSVTWTASGGGTAPQQPGSFAIQVGAFPAHADQMEFTGTVTYADGKVVNFDQPAGTQATDFARTLSSSDAAVTVTAKSTAGTTAVQPVAPAAPALAPTTSVNPITNWMTTVVKSVLSVW